MTTSAGGRSPRAKRTSTATRPYQRPSLAPTHSASFSGDSRPTLPQSYAYPSPQDSSPISQSQSWTPSHRASYPMPTISHLMPPPPAPMPPPGPHQGYYTHPQMNMNLMQQSAHYPSPAFSTSSESISPDTQQFGFYPQSYPVNPYLEQPQPYEYSDWTVGDDQDNMSMNMSMSMNISERPSDMDSDMFSMSQTSRATTTNTTTTTSKTPRPPNAWILYRSDKLKAIAAGEVIPGLDSVMSELNPSGSSASPSTEDGDDTGSRSRGKTRHRAPKKGTKPPTEGLLSLGRGKLGRGLPQADISKMISMLWKRESPIVRDHYETLALVKKREHQMRYPDYKFQPQRKADKIRIKEEKEKAKEAVKRQKELQKSAGCKPRKPLNKRSSPAASSSRASINHDYAPSLIHESGNEESLWAGSQNIATPMTESASLPIENRLRSYPFPMPPGSLPSMRPEDHAGNNPYNDSPVIEQDGFEIPSMEPKGLDDLMDPSLEYQGYSQPAAPGPGPMAAQQQQPQQQWQRSGGLSIIDVPSTGQLEIERGDIPATTMPESLEPDEEETSHTSEATAGRQSKSRRSTSKGSPGKHKADRLASLWSTLDDEEKEDAEDQASADGGDDPEEVVREEMEDSAEDLAEPSTIIDLAIADSNDGEQPGGPPGGPPDGPPEAPVPEQEPDIEEYQVHSGPWTFVMPDGQALQHDFTLAAHNDPAAMAAETGMTVGEWYDMNAQLNRFMAGIPTDYSTASSSTAPAPVVSAPPAPTYHHSSGGITIYCPPVEPEPPLIQFFIPDNVYEEAQSQMMMQFTPMAQTAAAAAHDAGPFLSQAPMLSPLEVDFGRSGLTPITQTEFNRDISGSFSNSFNNTNNGDDRVPSYTVTAANGRLLPYTVVPRHISAASSPAPIENDNSWAINDRSLSFGLAPEQDMIPEMDISEDLFWSSFEMAAPGDADQIQGAASMVNIAGMLDELVQASEAPVSMAVPVPMSNTTTMTNTAIPGPTDGDHSIQNIATSKATDMAPPVTRSAAQAARGGKRGRSVARKFDQTH